jgi:hypothetical protein
LPDPVTPTLPVKESDVLKMLSFLIPGKQRKNDKKDHQGQPHARHTKERRGGRRCMQYRS